MFIPFDAPNAWPSLSKTPIHITGRRINGHITYEG